MTLNTDIRKSHVWNIPATRACLSLGISKTLTWGFATDHTEQSLFFSLTYGVTDKTKSFSFCFFKIKLTLMWMR